MSRTFTLMYMIQNCQMEEGDHGTESLGNAL